MAQLEPPPFEDDTFSWRWRQWLATNRENTVYRGALIQKNQTQTVSTGFINTLVTFDEVGYDTGGLADVENNQLIVPDDGHRVAISCSVAWDSTGVATTFADSMRCIFIDVTDKNGLNIRESTVGKSGDELAALLRLQRMPGLVPSAVNFHINNFGQSLAQSISTGIIDVEPGDRFSIVCNHGRGSDIDIGTRGGNSSVAGYQRATWMSMVVYG